MFFCLALILFLGRASLGDTVYGPASTEAYAAGDFGDVPHHSFVSRPDLTVPSLNIAISKADQSPGYLFFNWVGAAAADGFRPGPLIYDHDGHLIWTSDLPMFAFNVKARTFKDQPVLSFWSGTIQQTHGIGSVVLLDSSYAIVRTVDYQSKSGIEHLTDLHEFVITDDDTFIMTSYGLPVQRDLTAVGGRQDGWINDAFFQEIDENSQVLFEWSALQAGVSVEEATGFAGPAANNSVLNPFDPFHINSIEKSEEGYLVSFRATSTLLLIDAQTGQIKWRLGGNRSDFSLTPQSSFYGQHDARWLNGPSEQPRLISMHDNQAPDKGICRGLVLEVDTVKMQVGVHAEYPTTRNDSSLAQGGGAYLDNGNRIITYGFVPEIAEFTPEGERVLDIFTGSIASQNTGPGAYRVFKENWVGKPKGRPAVGLKDGRVYVSWNGATEISTWAFVDKSKTGFSLGDRFPKTGFESDAPLDLLSEPSHVVVAALDVDGECLGISGLGLFADSSLRDAELSCEDLNGQAGGTTE